MSFVINILLLEGRTPGVCAFHIWLRINNAQEMILAAVGCPECGSFSCVVQSIPPSNPFILFICLTKLSFQRSTNLPNCKLPQMPNQQVQCNEVWSCQHKGRSSVFYWLKPDLFALTDLELDLLVQGWNLEDWIWAGIPTVILSNRLVSASWFLCV